MDTKYLTFDCYGTLINTQPLYQWVENLGDAAGLNGQVVRNAYATYENDSRSVDPYVDYTELVRADLKHLDQTFDQGHFFESHYVECLQVHRNLLPFPDVVATLETWQAQGYRLVIMSNSSWDVMPANLAALQVKFDAVIIAEDVHAYKPALSFFKTAETQLGLTATNHWHLAQGYGSDVVPAEQLGWPMIWVNRRGDVATGTAKPTHTVADLAAAEVWVK
ncbi:HAD family hydrolase [Lactiplantibacillus fabifermentans]|uniref:2-haloacid dehalogenase n=2 Tax=Lactiplantibacillus fabifermentans TaxID=483011 RepID=A0A0R2NVY8_9LACO|nr:HAD family hydrolase [Lactiplantibacillus fabifermentans]ETY73349.1 phosphohydrolase [Lactiplantibacillus fabifermentans T30PCM01]KRO28635.1 2-haloacid dehalogenase [Lactiplantibacillus fabifermentans DSM 21115]